MTQREIRSNTNVLWFNNQLNITLPFDILCCLFLAQGSEPADDREHERTESRDIVAGETILARVHFTVQSVEGRNELEKRNKISRSYLSLPHFLYQRMRVYYVFEYAHAICNANLITHIF